ncbi:hypothetical protein WCP94_004202 [Bilophila wadsworthia]
MPCAWRGRTFLWGNTVAVDWGVLRICADRSATLFSLLPITCRQRLLALP